MLLNCITQVRNVCHLADHLKPRVCDELMDSIEKKEGDAPDSPFIFNPYAAKRKSDARQVQQDVSRWVVGEECSLEVYIANPCAIQLKIERLCLCIEDVDGKTRADPISVAVVLPPKTKPTRVSLTVTPHQAGPLRVIGCHVTLYGVTWMQRFVASLRRVPRLPGVSFVDPEWGIEKNMVVEVDVIPPIPLLKWQFLKSESDQTWPATLQEPVRSTGSAEKDKTLQVLVRAGQRLDFKLRITNMSELPVLRAKLMPVCKEKGTAAQEMLNGAALSVEADGAHLARKLPMFPKEVTELPVRVLVGHRAAISNKEIPAKVKIQIGWDFVEQV